MFCLRCYNWSMLNYCIQKPRLATNSLLFLLVLKVVLEYSKSTGFLSELSDYCTGSTNCLLDGTIVIKLCKSTHSSEVLSSINHDDWYLSLSTKSTDELLVFIVLTVLSKAAKTSGTAVKSLSTLVKSLLKSIMDKSLLENL